MTDIRPYLPVIGMILATVLQALIGVVNDGLTTPELFTVVLAGLGAFAVYVVPALAQFPWLKTVVSAVTAAVVVLNDALTGGGHIDTQVLLTAAVALIMGLGVVAKTQKFTPSYRAAHAAA